MLLYSGPVVSFNRIALGMRVNIAGPGLRSSLNQVVLTLLGPVCTSFSRMGKGRRTSDPVFRTHSAYYGAMERMADCLLIENVPEYNQSVVEERLGSEWEVRRFRPESAGAASGKESPLPLCAEEVQGSLEQ